MNIRGLLKHSLIEYPGKISAVIFTGGCNFCCPFCYNVDLVNSTAPEICEKEVLYFLSRKKKWLDAVVISGGEPCLNSDLPEFCRKCQNLGLAVKLETNGSMPDMLQTLLTDNLLCTVQMDLKSAAVEYARFAGTAVDLDCIRKSVSLIRDSGISYEFVTTFIPGMHNSYEISQIQKDFMISEKHHRIQKFRPEKVLNREKLGACSS